MPETELNTKYKIGEKIRLNGFTSTTMNRSFSIKFTVEEEHAEIIDPMKCPVFMQIEFKGRQQFFHLNFKDYSAYPYENEILI